jgi:hypothetical protein
MFLSLVVGIIGSIEMFFKITDSLQIENNGSREFYILSCDIYKWLSLESSNRIESPREFLNESYTRYIKLIETSITLKKRIEDKLVDIQPISPDTPLTISTSPSTEIFSDTSSE